MQDIPTPLWRRRTTWIIVVGLVLAFALWRVLGNKTSTQTFATQPISRGDLVAKVTATGSVAAVVTVEVGSQVSGRVQSLYADFNSQVKKGQRIAKIDPSLFEAQVAQARANVSAARGNVVRLQVQLDEARRLAKRSATLFEQQIISENDRDSAESNANSAAAAVVQARGQMDQALAGLRQAETNLRYTDILAPTDGIVISRSVNVGQTVAASLQAPVLFTIAQDLRAMEVHTNVAESDIGRLRGGMDASFTVDAYPGERFKGRIREIRNAPQTVQNVVTYDAVIEVANTELKLKPGMTATVSATTAERLGVVRVPNTALRFEPPAANAGNRSGAMPGMPIGMPGMAGGNRRRSSGERSDGATPGTVVYVLVKGKPERRDVQSGLTDGTHTEIISGNVKENEPVIVGLETPGSGARSSGMGGR